MKHISKVVKKKREILGFSKYYVSKASGVSYPTVTKIERGGDVSVHSLQQVGKVLGLELFLKNI